MCRLTCIYSVISLAIYATNAETKKKISRINENVSDKNMCDTFDTPSKRPLAAFMAAVAVCVSKFFFYSILLCVAQVYSSVCVCASCACVSYVFHNHVDFSFCLHLCFFVY